MPNIINKLLNEELQKEFKGKDSILVVGFNKWPAQDAHELRGKLTEEGIKLRVVKNRIAIKAFESIGLGELGKYLKGQCAIAYGDDEASAIKAAKILEEAMKGKKKDARPLKVKAAYMEGKVIPPEEAENLHTLPDKDTLRSMLIGVIQAPLRKLAVCINEPGAQICRAINAHFEEKKE